MVICQEETSFMLSLYLFLTNFCGEYAALLGRQDQRTAAVALNWEVNSACGRILAVLSKKCKSVGGTSRDSNFRSTTHNIQRIQRYFIVRAAWFFQKKWNTYLKNLVSHMHRTPEVLKIKQYYNYYYYFKMSALQGWEKVDALYQTEVRERESRGKQEGREQLRSTN